MADRAVRRAVAAASVLVVGLGTLTGCALWGPEGGPGASGASVAASAGVAPGVTASPGADGVQRVAVTMTDQLTLDPSVVYARTGVIEFVFRNAGTTPHDVRVAAPTAATTSETGNVNGGGSATVRVSVSTPGRYPFPCLYHETSGMRGVLIVAGAPLAVSASG